MKCQGCYKKEYIPYLGLTSYCSKECKNICNYKNKQYYYNNKELYQKYRESNKSKNKEYQNKYQKIYYLINIDKYVKKIKNQSIYQKNKKRMDNNFRISCNLRVRINQILNGRIKSGSAIKDLGCTVDELKIYLEKQFRCGMSWENYGKWHIDHIKPLSSFNLSNREEFLKACHYTNLQPLWAEENLKKSNRI